MATVTLGFEPYELVVVLAWGGGWYVELTVAPEILPDGFPDGTEVYLEWHTTADIDVDPFTTWTATVDGGTAAFDQDPASVRAVLAAAAKVARLHYRDSEGHLYVWAGGKFMKK